MSVCLTIQSISVVLTACLRRRSIHLNPPTPTKGFVVGEDDEHGPTLAGKGGRYGRVPPTVSAGAEEEGLIGDGGRAMADGEVLVQAGAVPAAPAGGGEAEMTVGGLWAGWSVGWWSSYMSPCPLFHVSRQSLAAVQNARGDTSCGVMEEEEEEEGKGGGGGAEAAAAGKKGAGGKKGGFFGNGRR